MSKLPLKCRKCGTLSMQRTRRHGFLARRVLPLFGFYPWKCELCGTISFRRVRSQRK
jgi:hypothetical protein